MKKYADRARTLIFNTKETKNIELKEKIIKGEVAPIEFVNMDPHDLASKEKQVKRQESKQFAMDSRRSDWAREQAKNSKANVGMFTCKKCKSKNTDYYQMQTRGADEPMTNFVTCMDCGAQFKF